ncbi:MAG: hypothetical protein COB69_08145 [Phycisphaera sp.]|nr:MAG: hypothetical protein COB69_08145 [Phycisphaera sp.]
MSGVTSYDTLDSLKALVSDAYVNLKVTLKLELPKSRETVLELFDRVRRQYPTMNQFGKHGEELALETGPGELPYRWLAVRARNIRSGVVNPDNFRSAHALHQHVLEVIPYYLNISPLDIDSVELLFGADISAAGNHDEAVYNALIADSPLSNLLVHDCTVTDCQPVLTSSVPDEPGVEVQYEVKTRCHGNAREGEHNQEPISVYLTMRKTGPLANLDDLGKTYEMLAKHGEHLVEHAMIPSLVVPIRGSVSLF